MWRGDPGAHALRVFVTVHARVSEAARAAAALRLDDVMLWNVGMPRLPDGAPAWTYTTLLLHVADDGPAADAALQQLRHLGIIAPAALHDMDTYICGSALATAAVKGKQWTRRFASNAKAVDAALARVALPDTQRYVVVAAAEELDDAALVDDYGASDDDSDAAVMDADIRRAFRQAPAPLLDAAHEPETQQHTGLKRRATVPLHNANVSKRPCVLDQDSASDSDSAMAAELARMLGVPVTAIPISNPKPPAPIFTGPDPLEGDASDAAAWAAAGGAGGAGDADDGAWWEAATQMAEASEAALAVPMPIAPLEPLRPILLPPLPAHVSLYGAPEPVVTPKAPRGAATPSPRSPLLSTTQFLATLVLSAAAVAAAWACKQGSDLWLAMRGDRLTGTGVFYAAWGVDLAAFKAVWAWKAATESEFRTWLMDKLWNHKPKVSAMKYGNVNEDHGREALQHWLPVWLRAQWAAAGRGAEGEAAVAAIEWLEFGFCCAEATEWVGISPDGFVRFTLPAPDGGVRRVLWAYEIKCPFYSRADASRTHAYAKYPHAIPHNYANQMLAAMGWLNDNRQEAAAAAALGGDTVEACLFVVWRPMDTFVTLFPHQQGVWAAVKAAAKARWDATVLPALLAKANGLLHFWPELGRGETAPSEATLALLQ